MTTFETLRQRLEDVETLHHLTSASLQSRATPETPHELLSTNPPTTSLQAENLAHALIARIQQTAGTLLHTLERAPAQPHAAPQSAFYTALRNVRETHRVGVLAASVDPLAGVVYPEFSGEENDGRCLDLLQFHRAYVNIAGVQRVDYVTYLRELTQYQHIPPSVRGSKRYEAYLETLFAYLETFAKKAHPLEVHILGDVLAESRKRIEAVMSEISATYASSEALLHDLGVDGVKQRLLESGLKCGGRGTERAERLLKAARDGRHGARAVLESGVNVFLDALCEERFATIANVERKLAQSYREVEADRQGVVEESDEDEEETIYNPKDIPLGWDGKPMPYWMYKLHGLNHVFKCEICGGASYRGPRAFERHFSEGVHVAGLRRLGVGYSKAYMMITRIDDAVRLKNKLEKGKERTVDVEFEDADGNVMNERTYRDLKRQGLI